MISIADAKFNITSVGDKKLCSNFRELVIWRWVSNKELPKEKSAEYLYLEQQLPAVSQLVDPDE